MANRRGARGGGVRASVKGGGTPRFRYDSSKGIYVYKKHGGGFLSSLGKSISKGVSKAVPKIVKASKPIGRKILKKGIKVATNKKNQKALIKMAADAGGNAIGRMTGDPQMARLTAQQISAAASRAKGHLAAGSRVNKRFVRRIVGQ